MASYKIEIVQKHGKYHMAFYETPGQKGNPLDSKPVDAVDDLVKSVQAEIEKRKVDAEKDTVIFRNIGYNDFAMLAREIKKGTY